MRVGRPVWFEVGLCLLSPGYHPSWETDDKGKRDVARDPGWSD